MARTLKSDAKPAVGFIGLGYESLPMATAIAQAGGHREHSRTPISE
jgi:hypothetical protein